MADKDPNPGHSMFGLNDEPTRRVTGPVEAPASPQPDPAAPQYVYVQQAPQPVPATGGGKALPWLVAALAVLAIANLILVLMARSQFSDYATKQADAMNLITRRMDSSDERYAQLRGQFQVTSEKLGLTQQELARAHALAAEVQQQQQTAVANLNRAIAQKASADEVNKLQADSNAKIGGLSTDLAGTKQDLANTKWFCHLLGSSVLLGQALPDCLAARNARLLAHGDCGSYDYRSRAGALSHPSHFSRKAWADSSGPLPDVRTRSGSSNDWEMSVTFEIIGT